MFTKKIPALLLAALMVLGTVMIGPAGAAAREGGGWLKMSANKTGARYIVDSNNRPFHLFGMARCQYHTTWESNIIEGGAYGLASYYKDLGCNSIRLSFYFNREDDPGKNLVEECGGFTEAGINRYIDLYVEPDLRAIIDAGMYVVLDLHEYPVPDDKDDPDPAHLMAQVREQYIPVWAALAKRYKDEPMIAMFELWNEPYAADAGTLHINSKGYIDAGKYRGYDWNREVCKFFIDCVDEIRKYDTRHILLISDFNAGWGTGWATSWNGPPCSFKNRSLLDPEYNNILFSAHAAERQLREAYTKHRDHWANICDFYNIGIQFGEVELEDELASVQSIANFVTMLSEKEATHHYAAMLWRPHLRAGGTNGDDYAGVWSDFAKAYTSPASGDTETPAYQLTVWRRSANFFTMIFNWAVDFFYGCFYKLFK